MALNGRRSGDLFVELERPQFGQILRQHARVSSEELRRALWQQQCLGGRLGEILCEHGVIAQHQIFEVLQAQAAWVARSVRGDLGGMPLPYPARLSLCLPAYNEEAVIEDTLRTAGAMLPEFVEDYEIVVVDDGSRDRTAEIVSRLAERDSRIRLERHARNGGYGAAVTTGLRAASGDLVMFSDSDGQFTMLDLPNLLARLEGHDLVIGYRYPRADRWMRKFNAWAWSRLIGLVLGASVTDLDCAYKLFRREVVERLSLTATGACISAEMMVQCLRGGLHVAEVPVRHYPRYHGAPTGANLKVITRAFRELPTLWHYRKTARVQFDHLPSASRPGMAAAAPNRATLARGPAETAVPEPVGPAVRPSSAITPAQDTP